MILYDDIFEYSELLVHKICDILYRLKLKTWSQLKYFENQFRSVAYFLSVYFNFPST